MEGQSRLIAESVDQPEWIYETAPVGLCLLDTDLRYVRINARLAAINGKPASAHIGRRMQEVIPGLAPTVEPTLRQVLRTGEPVIDLEIHGTTPSEPEAERFWLCSFHPVKSADGRVRGLTAAMYDITPLKRAEEESRVLKEYLDTILLNLPVGVAILEGPDFRYFRINKWLAELNGRTVEDHLDKTVAEVLPDSRLILPNLRKVRDGGEEILNREFTTRLPSNPDKEVHLMDFHFPITVAGEKKAVGAVVLDITARRNAEEALRRSEARYHHVFECTPVSICEEDCSEFGAALDELKQQGVQDFRRYFEEHPGFVQRAVRMFKVLDVNQETVEMFGARSKDQMLTSLENIFVPETMKVFREELIAVAEGARHFEAETVVQTLQGKKLNVLFAIAFSDDESQLNHAVVTLSDITERRRAEDALREAHEQLEQQVKERTTELVQANTALRAENAQRREAQQALEKSEQSLRMLLETTHAVPWAGETKTFQFTYVGPRALELLGYPTDQWYDHDFWPDHIYPHDRDAAVDHRLTSWRHLTAFEFEYRMIAADGRIVWIHDMVNVTRPDGEPAVLYGFMIDVTERKRADEEMRQLREQIAHVSRVATMGELAASVAHELNQPLTAIVSNARAGKRLLARESVDHDELRAILEDVAADSLRGGEVIRRLRDLLKKGESQRQTLDINEVVLEVLPLVRSDSVRRNVSLEHQMAPGLPPVTGDRVQLQQVVLNLILNGLDAMDDVAAERRTLTLETSIGEAGTVQIAVRDSGVGLDPEHADRIFQPFYTTKPQGMGMGLAINRSIVEAHGGRLWATPNADQGAAFAFTLPAAGSD